MSTGWLEDSQWLGSATVAVGLSTCEESLPGVKDVERGIRGVISLWSQVPWALGPPRDHLNPASVGFQFILLSRSTRLASICTQG